MGTDAEETVKRIREALEYFVTCTLPENDSEIWEAFEELETAINRNKE